MFILTYLIASDVYYYCCFVIVCLFIIVWLFSSLLFAQAFPCISTGIYGKLNLSYFTSLPYCCIDCFSVLIHVSACVHIIGTMEVGTQNNVPVTPIFTRLWLWGKAQHEETCKQVHLTPRCTKTQPSVRWTKCRPLTMLVLPCGTRYAARNHWCAH